MPPAESVGGTVIDYRVRGRATRFSDGRRSADAVLTVVVEYDDDAREVLTFDIGGYTAVTGGPDGSGRCGLYLGLGPKPGGE